MTYLRLYLTLFACIFNQNTYLQLCHTKNSFRYMQIQEIMHFPLLPIKVALSLRRRSTRPRLHCCCIAVALSSRCVAARSFANSTHLLVVQQLKTWSLSSSLWAEQRWEHLAKAWSKGCELMILSKTNSCAPSDDEYRYEALHSTHHTKAQTNYNMIYTMPQQFT